MKIAKYLLSLTFFCVLPASPDFGYETNSYNPCNTFLFSIQNFLTQKSNGNLTLKLNNISLNIETLKEGLNPVLNLSVLEKVFPLEGFLNIKTFESVSSEGKSEITIKGIESKFLTVDKISVYKDYNGIITAIFTNISINPKKNLGLEPFKLGTVKVTYNPKLNISKVIISNIFLLQGKIKQVTISKSPTLNNIEIKGIKNISLNKILLLAKVFNPSLNVNLPNSLLDINTVSFKGKGNKNKISLKGLEVIQEGYPVLDFDKIFISSDEGLIANGQIEEFVLNVNNQKYTFDGSFQKSDTLKGTDVNLDFYLPNIQGSLEGYLNFNLKKLTFVGDYVDIKIAKQNKKVKDKKAPSRNQKENKNFEINFPIPTLPIDVDFSIKKTLVRLPIQGEYFQLKPIQIKDIQLKYSSSDKLYLVHSSFCYTDLWMAAASRKGIEFMMLAPDTPLSSIRDCIFESINVPFINKFFGSGRINLAVYGKLDNDSQEPLKGIFYMSLLNGYIYMDNNFLKEGTLANIYTTIKRLLEFLNIDVDSVNFYDYTTGVFVIKNKHLKASVNTTFEVTNPLKVVATTSVRYVIDLIRLKPSLEIRGSARLPTGEVKLIEIRRK
jgi:hypothetical protein